MQQYICKCGRTFQKSTKADTTGYVLENYSAQHECYGCPYIIVERDWISREITKIECRGTANISYATRCQISTADNDHRACYIYSLDLLFIKEVFDYISTLEGAEHGENINCVPDEWRAADFGKCYSYDDCEGLAIFPIVFKKNKKGTAARRAVKERFFTENNYRKDVTAADEAEIIAAYIKFGKEFATASIEEEKQMGKIDFTAIKNSRKAIEDKVEDNIPTELEESYSGVWGGKEKITVIEISRLKPYMDKNGGQPYKINPKKVEQIAASATDIGIITPLRVRSKGEIYEVICGHHRLEAAKSLGQISVPCIVKDYSDDEVFKILTESNIQRDRTLPSEYGKIFARYMELRSDDETTAEEIAVKFDVSRKTMYRYLDVNRLIPELQEMTDTGIVNIGAVEYISKLDIDVQNTLYQALDEAKVKLSAALAKRVRSLFDSQNGLVEVSDIIAVLTDKEDKKPTVNTYENIRKKYNVTISDNELYELTARLLDEYFQSVSR